MRIQTVVQHAGDARAHLLPGLLAALPEGSTVVTDPGGKLRSPWRCYLRCLQALEPDASHLLVIQDDAQPCRDFTETLDLVAQRHLSDPVALFVPGMGLHLRRVLSACASDQRYVEISAQNTFIPAVAVLWPRASVDSILAFEAERPAPESVTADDGVLGRWSEVTRTRVLACVPSLVEHPDFERSLIGKMAMAGRNPARRAACWTGLEMSPLELNW